jgi:hypothetical protein
MFSNLFPGNRCFS